jgi:hypothetical protein
MYVQFVEDLLLFVANYKLWIIRNDHKENSITINKSWDSKTL